MVDLNPQIIKKGGKKEYAVLPYEEYLKIREELQSYDDLRCLRKAKEMEKNAPTIGIEELRKQVGRIRRSTASSRKGIPR